MKNIIKGILVYGSIVAVVGYIPTFIILAVLALAGKLDIVILNKILIPYGLLAGLISTIVATMWFDD